MLVWLRVAALIVAFGCGWYFSGLRIDRALKSQEIKLKGECNDQKAITQSANEDLQNQLHRINQRLIASERLPAVCAKINAGMAEHSSGGGKHDGQNGLSASWLRRYAAECETYRIELITLNSFGKEHCK